MTMASIEPLNRLLCSAINYSGHSAMCNQAPWAGGDVNITIGSLSLINGVDLGASTSGKGDAGSVNIKACHKVFFNGVNSKGQSTRADSTVGSTGVGNSRNINITTGLLSVTNGALLSVETRGKANAGSVNINAPDRV